MGFWTEEYVGVFTKDGTIDAATQTVVDAHIASLQKLMTHTDLTKVAKAKTAGECGMQTVWGIF